MLYTVSIVYCILCFYLFADIVIATFCCLTFQCRWPSSTVISCYILTYEIGMYMCLYIYIYVHVFYAEVWPWIRFPVLTVDLVLVSCSFYSGLGLHTGFAAGGGWCGGWTNADGYTAQSAAATSFNVHECHCHIDATTVISGISPDFLQDVLRIAKGWQTELLNHQHSFAAAPTWLCCPNCDVLYTYIYIYIYTSIFQNNIVLSSSMLCLRHIQSNVLKAASTDVRWQDTFGFALRRILERRQWFSWKSGVFVSFLSVICSHCKSEKLTFIWDETKLSNEQGLWKAAINPGGWWRSLGFGSRPYWHLSRSLSVWVCGTK